MMIVLNVSFIPVFFVFVFHPKNGSLFICFLFLSPVVYIEPGVAVAVVGFNLLHAYIMEFQIQIQLDTFIVSTGMQTNQISKYNIIRVLHLFLNSKTVVRIHHRQK